MTSLAPFFPSAAARPTRAMIACTSTSAATNASERAWLKPSADRRRWKASRIRLRRPSVEQRLARVVAGQLPRLGNRRCGAHALLRCRFGDADADRRPVRRGPSGAWSSRGRRRRARTASTCPCGRRTSSPLVVCTNGDFSAFPSAVRLSARVHCSIPSAVTTPSSRRPSSGLASSKASMPPRIVPTLPTSTQLASPSNHVVPSTRIARPHARAAEVLRAREDVGEPTDSVLHAADRRRGSCARRTRHRP